MKIFNIDETFEILKSNKITTNKESVRRWLRQGVIKGIIPTTRKDGWKVSENELLAFIKSRLPESHTTNVTHGGNTTLVANNDMKNMIRAEMWEEIVRKNIWEGYIEVKKTFLRKCLEHRKYSNELEDKVWQACLNNSKVYSKPRINYLLDACSFQGERLLLDNNFESLEEQIMFPVIEHVRKSR